jgi:hypothetical protein
MLYFDILYVVTTFAVNPVPVIVKLGSTNPVDAVKVTLCPVVKVIKSALPVTAIVKALVAFPFKIEIEFKFTNVVGDVVIVLIDTL